MNIFCNIIIYYYKSELLEIINYACSYPPEKAKIALATAIVREFPLLKDVHSIKGYVSTLISKFHNNFYAYNKL